MVFYLAVRKFVEQTACLEMLHLEDNVPVTTARRGRHDVLVKWKRNEYDDNQQVNDSANGAHTFWTLVQISVHQCWWCASG